MAAASGCVRATCYRVEAFSAAFDLTPGVDGIIVPEVLHHVTPLGLVRFYVEFYRAQEA